VAFLSGAASGSWVGFCLGIVLASLAAGCNQGALTPSPVPNPVTGQNPGDVKYYPSDQPVRLGIQRFYDGNFGLAQRYFQDAVEKSPQDVTAWIGLAASYDRLGRFDLADRAYGAAAKLEGETPQLLNNEGYSYMLRGDLKAAAARFHQALKLDPKNQTTLNNIKLLNSSQTFIERSGSGEPCGSVDCSQ
jgi:tetratricopeptide (TPR) repeat protein